MRRIGNFNLAHFSMVISYLIVSSVSQLRVTKKSILSLFSSFGKEEWSQTEVVGEIMFIPIFL